MKYEKMSALGSAPRYAKSAGSAAVESMRTKIENNRDEKKIMIMIDNDE